MSSENVKTTFLVLSDTHGQRLRQTPQQKVDVVVHCGDLTQHSKLDEFRTTIELLKDIDAPLKLVIAGNHDFSLDLPVFKKKLDEGNRLGEILNADLVTSEYGSFGEAQELLSRAAQYDIHFLTEGTYSFSLENGTCLNVYASPYTPSPSSADDLWGFQYSSTHDFDIPRGTDLVITHGPPKGLFDMTAEKSRIGCGSLFAAVARAQPKVHCFGHVHNGWGSKFVSWRPTISEKPSHFSDIDNEKSALISNLTKARATAEGDFPMTCRTSHCTGDELPWEPGKTLFVNAATAGPDGVLSQPMWLVDIGLAPSPKTSSDQGTSSTIPLRHVKRTEAATSSTPGSPTFSKNKRRKNTGNVVEETRGKRAKMPSVHRDP